MTATGSEGAASEHATHALERAMCAARDAGALLKTADEAPYTGRHVVLDGRARLNFASTSYLGLELREELTSGALEAARRFGTQFPLPGGFVQCPLYRSLEASLDDATGGHVVIAPSTTLAHQAALGVLVEPGDAVLVASDSHPSQHVACRLLREVPVGSFDRKNPAALEDRLKVLGRTHHRVWCLLDGLASLHGDVAPFDALNTLQARYPFLHLYVDDAHATSWTGRHGRGLALERLDDLGRVVSVLSLNKAFAASGSALVFSDTSLAGRVRRTGGPLLFSGPVPPPMLGAAVASARLHLSDELVRLQAALQERIDWFSSASTEKGIPLANRERTPLFFVPCGSSEKTLSVFHRLMGEGICVCPAVPPLAPEGESGLRVSLTAFQSRADIELITDVLATRLADE
jgi:7-keto-8-aminopelargonate synthetase-like enzyme